MRAEKLGITLQRFRKYSSSFRFRTAGFDAEKRRRIFGFSAVVGSKWSEAVFLRSFSTEVSAGAVESVCERARTLIETVSSNLQARARTGDRSASSRRFSRPST